MTGISLCDHRIITCSIVSQSYMSYVPYCTTEIEFNEYLWQTGTCTIAKRYHCTECRNYVEADELQAGKRQKVQRDIPKSILQNACLQIKNPLAFSKPSNKPGCMNVFFLSTHILGPI